jgi:hypothetical protein
MTVIAPSLIGSHCIDPLAKSDPVVKAVRFGIAGGSPTLARGDASGMAESPGVAKNRGQLHRLVQEERQLVGGQRAIAA